MNLSSQRSNRRVLVLLLVMAMSGGVLAGCSAKTKKVEEVTIALLAPLTGVSAPYGTRTAAAFKLGATLANEGGGIKSLGGAKVKVIVADTESKVDVAGSQAEKLVADPNVMVLAGTNQSAAGLVASQVAERAKISYVSGSDQDPLLTSRGFKYLFRLPAQVEAFAKAVVDFVKTMGESTGVPAKKWAILAENSVVGQSALKSCTELAEGAGFEVVDGSSYDAANTKDFTSYISKYKAAQVECLALYTRPNDGVLITRACKELDYNPTVIIGIMGAIGDGNYLQTLGKDANYVYASTFTPEMDLPGLSAIRERLEKETGEGMDVNHLMGLNAVGVIIDAIERAGKLDRQAIRDALAATDIKTGEKSVYEYGGVKFDASGQNIRSTGIVQQIMDGKLPPVYPKDIAKATPVWPRPEWKDIK